MAIRHYVHGDIRSGDGRAYCKAHDSFESVALHPCFSAKDARTKYRNHLKVWCRIKNVPDCGFERPNGAQNLFIRKLRI